MNNKYTITLIIPLLNEEDNVNFLVEQLNKYFAKIDSFNTEVIFVNDGSSDNTFQKIANAKHDYYKARVCNLSKNYGSHAALRAGILLATGDFICFLFADLQDPVELVGQLYETISTKFDIVWAKRKTIENAFFNKFFSKRYALLMKKYVSPLFPEQGFDIVMFSRKVANELNRNIENNSSIFLQILTLGYSQSSIEYVKVSRKIGKSKWTLSTKIKLFIDSFVAFSYAPIRFVTIMGIIFSTGGFFWTIYILIRKILIGNLSPGWPALISVLLIGFGITNISIGIIAEYLWRTLDASRKRPVFIIDEIIELNQSD